ncbi:MAG: single-stranded-DNA-specific exonuclease RecJ [Anaerolineae bacterium]
MSILAAWRIAPPAPDEYLLQARHDGARLDPLLAQILYNRGVADPAGFLFETGADDLKQRLLQADLLDLDRGANRIVQAIARGEQICIYGDFDADGVTSTALMIEALSWLGANVRAYIPDRVDEGYGLNIPALKRLASEGVSLVVTVDCGVRSVSEIEAVLEDQLDIVVTDHHSVGEALPPAFAVVNPQRPDSDRHEPYRHIAGVSVALLMALRVLRIAGWPNGHRLSDLLDLVAIGTVADVMRLNDPLNRRLVIHGLNVINERRRLGLDALLHAAGFKGTVTAETIGFVIGPRINAAGRLASGMIAFELLTTRDQATANHLAKELERLNVDRQGRMRIARDRIRDSLMITGDIDAPLIFAQDDEVEPGIVGLVAGQLTQELYRPSIILHREQETSRASCRSIPEFHITRALDACADLLLRHGGHALAAGFTVANENVPLLRERLLRAAREAFSGLTLAPVRRIDASLSLSKATLELAEKLATLEPFGHHFEAPLFFSGGVRMAFPKVLKDRHLKMRLIEGSVAAVEAIAFNQADFLNLWNGQPVDVVYRLTVNEYNGRRSAQLNVEDMRLTGSHV